MVEPMFQQEQRITNAYVQEMDVGKLYYLLPGESSTKHALNDLRFIYHSQCLYSDGKVYRLEAAGVNPQVLALVSAKLKSFETLQRALNVQKQDKQEDRHQ